MIRTNKTRRRSAFFLLTIYTIQLLSPLQVLALTSGPSQPEFSSFQAADVSNMVNLFTGDLNYNLPLMEVDGYPLNISYQSGVGMDDEATWVGLGWNLNVGTLNRNMRGVADDMDGSKGDVFKITKYQKDKLTVGFRGILKAEAIGIPLNQLLGKSSLSLNGSLGYGIFSDTYTGIGAELSLNAGLSIATANAGKYTAGLGVNSNTASGVTKDFSLSSSFLLDDKANVETRLALSASIGHNTRSGLTSLTLTNNITKGYQKKGEDSRSSAIGGGRSVSFNDVLPSPRIDMEASVFAGSVSFDAGPTAQGGYIGAGFTGYLNERAFSHDERSFEQYGLLYAEKGKDNSRAIHDFQSEKESMFIAEMPALPVTVPQPDLYSFTNQLTSGQFKLHRSGSGTFYNPANEQKTTTTSLGGDLGVGAGLHLGGSFYYQEVSTGNNKWTDKNEAGGKIDFKEAQYYNDESFFKLVGEYSAEDMDYLNSIQFDKPVSLKIGGETALSNWNTSLSANRLQSIPVSAIQRKGKFARSTNISYLTAEHAALFGLDRKLNRYSFNHYGTGNFSPAAGHALTKTEGNRYSNTAEPYRLGHHISEFTVLSNDGSRHVYGIPVYNIKQEDYVYSIGHERVYAAGQEVLKNNNLYKTAPDMTPPYSEMTDMYYSREIHPAYVTSYLLSGIVSADYVDRTGNGISDDDHGTAIKFNYSKVAQSYKWRTPYNINGQGMAHINRGALSDDWDDKATVSYGEKELWYVHSIETKNYIAYFITEDRKDGYGVTGLYGGIDSTGARLKALREIKLYSKSDTLTPVKVVKFDYDYSLVKGTPNSSGNGGKLTLKKVSFYSNNNKKGLQFPYEFEYNNENSDQINYDYLSSDRWGTYKRKNGNDLKGIALRNDEYPYTTQDKGVTDRDAQAWLLKRIKLPSGGLIDINYESDDYAYVQDKKAAYMLKPQALVDRDGNVTADLWNAEGVKIQLDTENLNKILPQSGIDLEWVKKHLLADSDQMLCRMYVDVGGIVSRNSPNKKYEIITAYATVNRVTRSGNELNIYFQKVSEDKDDPVNPILHAALQKMRLELPQYAYPGYDSRVKKQSSSGMEATVKAFYSAIKNMSELFESFQNRARRMNFATVFDLNKSTVRIVKTDGKKLGGGVRVKKVVLDDRWADMLAAKAGANTYGASNHKSGIYYDYTTTDEYGREISSGVASYEPFIGGEENILKQPVKYVQNVKGAKNNLFFFEEPFGEMMFPSPSVGYSKVTTYALNHEGNKDMTLSMGYQENEFYTAKDFPTLASYQTIQRSNVSRSDMTFLIASFLVDKRIFSQGFLLELNDMHGKPRKSSNYNKQGVLISSEETVYKTGENYQGKKVPGTVAPTINDKGEVNNNSVIGVEVELFTQMNEAYTESHGESFFGGSDLIVLFPLVYVWGNYNQEERVLKYASTTKIMYRYGIVDKVIKTINGSTSEARNLVYDAYSGQPIVVESKNEFDQPVYQTSIPAYWMYENMGGAYKNSGAFLKGITTGYNGVIRNENYQKLLQDGDVLYVKENSVNYSKLWVVTSKSLNGSDEKRLINEYGNVYSWNTEGFNAYLYRSGYKNQLNLGAASFVTLENPLSNTGGMINLLKEGSIAEMKVLNASISTYDNLRFSLADCGCPQGYVISTDNRSCIKIPQSAADLNFYAGYLTENTNQNGVYLYSQYNVNENNDSYRTLVRSPFFGGDCSIYNPDVHRLRALPCDPTSTPNNCDTVAPCPNPNNDCTPGGGPGGPGEPGGPGGPGFDCSSRMHVENNGNVCGRYWTHSIWLCRNSDGGFGLPYNQNVTFWYCLDIPETKQYYLAFGGDKTISIKIGNNQIVNNVSNEFTTEMIPVTLSEGYNLLEVTGYNDKQHAAIFAEIYDADYSQLFHDKYVPEERIIFSTGRDVKANPAVQIRRGTTYKYSGMEITKQSVCEVPYGDSIANTVNPYVGGQYGSWYPSEQKTYLTERAYSNLNSNESNYLNLAQSGYLKEITAYWSYDRMLNKWKTPASTHSLWVSPSKVTLVDRFNNALEEKDVLGNYTSVIYGFNDKLPIATAQQARQKEIYFESFEDKINPVVIPGNCLTDIIVKHSANTNLSTQVSKTISHSGYGSVRLNNNQTLTINTSTNDFLPETRPQLYQNSKSEFYSLIDSSYYIRGFSPISNKEYTIQFWVKQNDPNGESNSVEGAVTGADLMLMKKAVVDEWVLMEANFTTTELQGSRPFNIQIKAVQNVYVDDIRIFPSRSLMKSFVYNYKNSLLMATIDEIGFASFYEYDDEGNLIRVKKESEKGVLTIQEGRKSLKKN